MVNFTEETDAKFLANLSVKIKYRSSRSEFFKTAFLKTSQISQENTCVGVTF